jgi:hypothetical protein
LPDDGMEVRNRLTSSDLRVSSLCYAVRDLEKPQLVRSLLVEEIPTLVRGVLQEIDLGNGVGINQIAGDHILTRRPVIGQH